MRRLLATTCGLPLLLGGLLSAQATAPPSTIPEMWGAWCVRCHGPDGSGRVASRPVPIEPLDFTDCRIATAEPDADWELAIAQGGLAVGLSSSMPAFGDVLSAEQIRAFVRYLRGFCKETGWPTGNLNLPRPILTDKAFPENEFFIAPVASHDPHEFAEFKLNIVFERRMGRRAQLEMFMPLESINKGQRMTGLGDAGFGFKYVLTPRASRYLLSSGAELVFDTGQESQIAGTRGVVFEPYVLVGTTVRRTYIQGRFALGFPSRSSWRARETAFGVYLGTDTSNAPDTWTIGVELTGEDRELGLTPQIRKALTRTGALAAAIGVTVPLTERRERGYQWVGYVIWEYLEPVRAGR